MGTLPFYGKSRDMANLPFYGKSLTDGHLAPVILITYSGVCSFSLNLDSFQVNSQKFGVQAPQNVEFE